MGGGDFFNLYEYFFYFLLVSIIFFKYNRLHKLYNFPYWNVSAPIFFISTYNFPYWKINFPRAEAPIFFSNFLVSKCFSFCFSSLYPPSSLFGNLKRTCCSKSWCKNYFGGFCYRGIVLKKFKKLKLKNFKFGIFIEN